MGVNIENCELIAHCPVNGSGTDYRLHIHQSSPAIDTTSTGYDQSDHDDLKTDAATSQSAFDSTAATLLGTWYSGQSSSVKAAFRQIYLDI